MKRQTVDTLRERERERESNVLVNGGDSNVTLD